MQFENTRGREAGSMVPITEGSLWTSIWQRAHGLRRHSPRLVRLAKLTYENRKFVQVHPA